MILGGFLINVCDQWFLDVNLYCFIGVMAADCWSELRGGCSWEVYNAFEDGRLLC